MLPRLLLIQKARHALRDGRLDEAFAIAAGKELRDHRQCQVILERLVEPLLARAAEHLAAGRLEDSLADVARAQEAGGNRPATAELREKVLAAVQRRRREREERERLLSSAAGHLRAGRLEAGAGRLAEAPPDCAEAARLLGRIEAARAAAAEARARLEEHLRAGELEAALSTAIEVQSLAREEPESSKLIERLAREAAAAIANALTAGELSRAGRLLEKLEAVEKSGIEIEPSREALALSDQAARALAGADWGRARIALGRLKRLLPGAAWIAPAEEKLAMVEAALAEIAVGPLGRRASALRGEEGRIAEPLQTVAIARPGPEAPAAAARGEAPRGEPQSPAAGKRFHLWVDGIGSFLLLASDHVTIGRAGSSALPDVALAADLEGVHAEVLRVEHDYFLIARGEVAAGGRRVERHLLADGDEVLLGTRARLAFRLPAKLSATAILELGSGLRLDGDVRKVILLDGHLIFGAAGAAHIEAKLLSGRVVLSAAAGGFRCRAPEPLEIDGKPGGLEEPVPLGARVAAGPLEFTLTAAPAAGTPEPGGKRR
jgi:hypothetical protein